jgi:hypothetical protein
MFTQPFYYGWFEYPQGSNQYYRGKHEPMITQEEYDRVQTLLGKRGNPRPQKHLSFAFTGLLRCTDCGRMVTAEEKHQVICGNCRFKFAYRKCQTCPRCETSIEKMRNPLFLKYLYYHCSKSKLPRCKQKSVRSDELEKQIEHYLSRIQISERFKAWAMTFLHEIDKKERACEEDIIQTQGKAYQECLRRMDNLVTLKTSPHNTDGSLLSDEEYGKQRAELLKQKAVLSEWALHGGQRLEKCLAKSEQAFDLAFTARERFATGNPETKKALLAAVGSNLTLKDRILSIQALEPFSILENTLRGNSAQPEPIEPKNMRQEYGQNEVNTSPSSGWRAIRDEDRTYRDKALLSAALIYAHFKKQFGFPTKR